MLERLVDSIGEGLVALDRNLRYVYVSEGAERLVGIARAGVIGRTPSDVLPGPILEQVMPHVHAALDTGCPVTVDIHLSASDRWLENRLYPSADGITILLVDVTERRRTAERLRRREEMQSLLVTLLEQTRHLRDADEVLWACVQTVGQHLRVSHCMFAEVDAAQQHLVVMRDYVDRVPSLAGRHRLEDFGAAVADVLRHGRSLVISDVATDPRTSGPAIGAAFEQVATRALVAVPLVKDGRLVAVLSVHQAAPRAWSEDEVVLLERVAEQTWFAVASARAEAALRESRDVLALAMRGGRMGAWSRDITSNEVWWSEELEGLFGLPPGGFGGSEDRFFEYVHPDDRQLVREAVQHAIATRSDYIVEFRFRHASGAWRWMDGRGRAVYDSDGPPRWLFGLGIDITEQKQAQSALEMAHAAAERDAQRLHLAMAAARLGDWSWHIPSDAVTFSPRGAEIYGVAPETHVTWAEIRERLHPDDVERTQRAVEEAVATHGDYAVEYRLVLDGQERWISVRGRPRLDAAGNVSGLLGVVQDVSPDRLLLRLEDEVRGLVTPDAITATVARLLGQHLAVHRCVYATVDASSGVLTVRSNYTQGIASLEGPYELREFGAEFDRLMRAGRRAVVRDARMDTRLTEEDRAACRAVGAAALITVPVLKAGHVDAVLAVHSSTPRYWSAQEVELVQQVAGRSWESIQRARVEQERAALLARERLARQQAERQNRRLAQLSEVAEAASRSKDEFMAMLGHELRNPLAPIATALQLMRLRGDDGSGRERVVIERQVNHLTRLVDDLLDVSRVARGRVELKARSVEVSEVIARAIEMASPLLEQRAHTLVVDVPRTGLPVVVDTERMSQVLSNLLTNAAKYTPRGGRIDVGAHREDDDVAITVRDTGIGMSAEVLPTVFELFVQGRQSSDRADGGLGLGLAIVRNIVEQHGGSVRAYSEGTGQGSEFTVRVPAATVPAEAVPATRPLDAESRIPAARVLIVDDNADAAEMLAHVLAARGHDVRVAYDGVQALQASADFLPQAAFLDLGLPVMDGYELASRLRELPGLDAIRLIAVTGYGQDSDRQRTRAAGFHHHLVKPVDITVLEALLA